MRTPERYIEAIAADRSAEAAGERLDGVAGDLEGLQLAVRTRQGVPVGALPIDDPAIESLVDVDVDRGRAVLNVHGRLLANEVAMRLRTPSPLTR